MEIMRKIIVLGSTGSIGTSALDVIARFPGRFKVSALSAYSNTELLLKQVEIFKPECVYAGDISKFSEFKKKLNNKKTKVFTGEDGLCAMLERLKADILIMGVAGSSALLPLLKSFDSVKKIALANKEALVMAGGIVMKKAKEKQVKILPVDSEHSAIFQCVDSRKVSEIKKIYLTGSGGPLLNVPKIKFKDVTAAQAVNHPRWKMGRKISIDSATMMNKGLEVIEAHHLFGLGIDSIEVLIHPEAVIHSMVEFIDNTILAHMGMCDMRSPIQYAVTYPSREKSPVTPLPFSKITGLHFSLPDFKKFPCLRLAYEAAKQGGTFPCALNGANETAVEEFLKGGIKFTDIPGIIERVLSLHKSVTVPGLKDILETHKWSRDKALSLT
jgi:1-deoxy-D-xylulose-5-phosphate reductoisomerase